MTGYTITRDKFLSVKEARKLLRVCQRNAALDQKANRTTWITRYMLIHLALHSGLRVSEMASLNVGDLHLNGKDNYLVVLCGKRGRKRDVYLDKELVKHLQEYLEIRRNTWKEDFESYSP